MTTKAKPAQQPTKLSPTPTTAGAEQTSISTGAADLPKDLKRDLAQEAGFDPTPPNRCARVDPIFDAPVQPAIAPLDSHHAPQPEDAFNPNPAPDDD